MRVRPPAVAGLFYPDDPEVLERAIGRYVNDADGEMGALKAIIAPHAGYVFSGPIAGSAYAQLAPIASQIRRVVVLGPAHRVPVQGMAVPAVDAFETPLGEIPIDRAAIDSLRSLPFVVQSDLAHRDEHSLEVQLPFLQCALGPFSLVPIVVGSALPDEIARVLGLLWGGPETLLVISSDLSHYHDAQSARELDAITTSAIESMTPEKLHHDSACGRLPIAGLLIAAKQRGLSVRTLDVRNSGDTAGRRDQVVGYGAYALG